MGGTTRYHCRVRCLVALLLTVACSSSHGDRDGGADDAGRDAGALDAWDPWTRPDAAVERTDAGIPGPPPMRAVCGGHACNEGEVCCLATSECFDPADRSVCAVSPDEPDPRACASNLDCDEGELCEHDDIFTADEEDRPPICSGAIGVCVMMRRPMKCGGYGEGVCGCDGRTYADPCAASRAGVRVIRYTPCGTPVTGSSTRYLCSDASPHCPPGWSCDVAAGECSPNDAVIACGIDAQCPEGERCCGILGVCVDVACPDCCRVPPDGTVYPCDDDGDCGFLGSDFGTNPFYCGGPGCGPAGGCVYRMSGGCGGELAPVCGCNGTSYTNPCWAAVEGVRIAHEGMCE